MAEPTKTDGLQFKYAITKADGSPLDENSEYFVLRLDAGGEPNHVAACRAAVLEYACHIEPHLPNLAADLRERWGGE